MQGYHESVLLREIVRELNIKPGDWYIDGTLGDGGHSLEIIKLGGNIFGIDVDIEALERVRKRFAALGIDDSRYVLVQGNFRDIKNLIQQTGTRFKFAGAIFDLGVSTMQLETSGRGFSFGKNGPLDMRMDQSLSVRALDLVNGLNKGELYELIYKFGEEKFARRIADAIISTRQVKPFSETEELALLIKKVVRGKTKIHPATKVFQALRIVVNDELNALKDALPETLERIEKNGRIAVISFHSLEDRIVKTIFREWENDGFGQVLTKKPIIPTDNEILDNPRSRSAKLRVFEKYDNH